MSYWDFDTLLDLKDGDILFFDEVLNGNPTVLNACLTILEEREMISGKKLPDIMIVAAANPQGMMPLTPQIKERFVWYLIKFNSTMWKDYMFDKYFMIKQVSSKLCDLITKEDFKGDRNYYSGRSTDKAVNMIINDVYTPYEDVIKPILSTLIENKLESKVKLTDGKELEVGEQMSWLDLIRLKNNVNLTNLIENNKEETISTGDNEILILGKDDNIIGEIKDINTLKLLYYFSDEEIKNIEKGIPVPARLEALGIVYFKKN